MRTPAEVRLRSCVTLEKGKPPAAQPYYGPDADRYLTPEYTPGEEWAMKAEELYKAGADGFAIWDAERRTPRASEWAVVRRLGHRENLERYAKEAPDYWRVRPIKMLGGIALKFSYTDG